MGHLVEDTAVEGKEGRYVARLSSDWQVWGPMGGYVAAVALRAAAAQATLPRPVAFACQFLSVADFAAVDLEVVTLRSSRRAESLRVSMTQAGRPVLEALVSVVAPKPGLTHDASRFPEVPRPEALKPIEELMPREQLEHGPGARFFKNFEERPIAWTGDWMKREAGEPTWTNWMRFRQAPRLEDAFLQAAQQLVLLDLGMWFATSMAYRPEVVMLIGPSLDLRVTFHRHEPAPEEWLLADGYSPLAVDGQIASEGRVWDARGRLLASGQQQLLCRPMPVMPASS